MTVRKNDNGKEFIEIAAKATVAITGNPVAGTTGGGLWCVLDTDPNYFVLAPAGSEPIGLCDSNVAANALATLRKHGIRLVRLGGTVAPLDYGEVGALGVSIKSTGQAPIVGQFLTGGVTGDFVAMMVGQKPSGNVGSLTVGGNVASAATIVPTGEVITLTGVATVTAITMSAFAAGRFLLIIFASTATVTLAHMVGGTMAGTADDTLLLYWDGTVLREVARSVNA